MDLKEVAFGDGDCIYLAKDKDLGARGVVCGPEGTQLADTSVPLAPTKSDACMFSSWLLGNVLQLSCKGTKRAPDASKLESAS
jgi:hypothetical protein